MVQKRYARLGEKIATWVHYYIKGPSIFFLTGFPPFEYIFSRIDIFADSKTPLTEFINPL